MGLSTKQFYTLVGFLLFILLYPIIALELAFRYGRMYGFVSLVVPYMFIVVYLAWKVEKKEEEIK